MRHYIANVGVLFAATGLMAAGESLLHTLLSLRGALEGFTVGELGILATGYYGGFLLGCTITPAIVRRAGHIRTYATLAAIAGAVTLLHVLVIHDGAWLLMRVVFGICISGVYMTLESWLNDATGNRARGRVFSIYRIFALGGSTLGQVLLTQFDPSGFQLFALISICLSISLVPIAVTTTSAPISINTIRIRPLHLLRVAPAGAFGCLAVGLVGGAYNGLAPVFALAAGLTTSDIGVFMALAVVGGAVFAWPVGALSDHFDRRLILLALTTCAAVFGGALYYAFTTWPSALIILSFAFGASAWSIYAIAIAHANDRDTTEDFVEIAAGLLVVFAVGAIIGPNIAAVSMSVAGPQGLFLYTAAVHSIYAAVLAWRLGQQKAVPAAETVPYASIPGTTPVVLEMDPRAQTAETGDA